MSTTLNATTYVSLMKEGKVEEARTMLVEAFGEPEAEGHDSAGLEAFAKEVEALVATEIQEAQGAVEGTEEVAEATAEVQEATAAVCEAVTEDAAADA